MAADLANAAATTEADVGSALQSAPAPLAAFWAAFRENTGALFGLSLLGLVVAMAVFAAFIAPHSPIEQFRDAIKTPPVWDAGGSWRYILGTDGAGRDMLSRLIYGARVSLFIGLSVMSVAFLIGGGATLAFAGTASANETFDLSPTCAESGVRLNRINELAEKLALHFWSRLGLRR